MDKLLQDVRYAEARPLYEEALALRREALGPEHHTVADVLHNLAALTSAEGDYATAEPMLLESLQISRLSL